MVPGKSTHRIKLRKVRQQSVSDAEDVVAAEEPLQISLTFEGASNGCSSQSHEFSMTMRTPGDDFNLAAGYLLSEGIIKQKDDIHTISHCVGPNKEKQQYNALNVTLRPQVKFDPKLIRNFYTNSSCGVCGKTSIDALKLKGFASLPPAQPRVPSNIIHGLPDTLRGEQSVFEKTGGLHAAALFTPQGKLLDIREDVGRHNAVDKLIGAQLLEGKLPLHQVVMLVSGRISFEIVQKALMAGIPILAAVGAPSSLAVNLANETGMTLLGFVRNEVFNIYAGGERIAE